MIQTGFLRMIKFSGFWKSLRQQQMNTNNSFVYILYSYIVNAELVQWLGKKYWRQLNNKFG